MTNAISNPEVWVDLHGDYLFRFALSRVRDPQVAEDPVQETLLAALRARDRFSGQSDERTWFVAILKNKIIDHFRKVTRDADPQVVGMSHGQDEDYRPSGERAGAWYPGRRPNDWAIDASDVVEQDQSWRSLQRCLSELPDATAAAFIMREIDEFEHEEICNKLELAPTNLRVILHRARKSLRRCLEKHWVGKTPKS